VFHARTIKIQLHSESDKKKLWVQSFHDRKQKACWAMMRKSSTLIFTAALKRDSPWTWRRKLSSADFKHTRKWNLLLPLETFSRDSLAWASSHKVFHVLLWVTLRIPRGSSEFINTWYERAARFLFLFVLPFAARARCYSLRFVLSTGWWFMDAHDLGRIY
jgi:hypothetical protein